MNKKTKKLALSRETLRNLADFGLRKAAGGTGFACTSDDTCETCVGTACDTCFSILPNCTEACATDRTC